MLKRRSSALHGQSVIEQIRRICRKLAVPCLAPRARARPSRTMRIGSASIWHVSELSFHESTETTCTRKPIAESRPAFCINPEARLANRAFLWPDGVINGPQNDAFACLGVITNIGCATFRTCFIVSLWTGANPDPQPALLNQKDCSAIRRLRRRIHNFTVDDRNSVLFQGEGLSLRLLLCSGVCILDRLR